MKTRDKEEIRQAVRESYGKVARIGTIASGISPSVSCCGETGLIEETNPATCGTGESEITPEKMSAAIGYSKEDLNGVPKGANLGLGCGNPVAHASLKPGETVVDLGKGTISIC